MNPDGTLFLSLAETYEISEDKRTYTFKLKDVLWSDGSVITAYDFEASWKSVLDPKFPSANAHLFYSIKNAERAKKGFISLDNVGIHADDEKTFRVVLERPTPYFLNLISFCSFFPIPAKSIFSDEIFDRANVFSGPFVLDNVKSNYEILLKRNERYWKKESILLDFIKCSIIDNDNTALEMFEKGELDILDRFPICKMDNLIDEKNFISCPMASTTFCSFNVLKSPFSNLNIRKAFSYAINREEIAINILKGKGRVALNMVPPLLNSNYYSNILINDNDVDNARACFFKGFEECGFNYNEPPEVNVIYAASEFHQQVAQALQQQWQDNFCIKVKLEKVERQLFFDRLIKGDFDIALTFLWAQYNDSMSVLERFKFCDNIKNYSSWEDSRYVDLLNLSFFDLEKRGDILLNAEKVFFEEMPVSPIFHSNLVFLVQPYVKNFDVVPLGGLCFDLLYIDLKHKLPPSKNNKNRSHESVF